MSLIVEINLDRQPDISIKLRARILAQLRYQTPTDLFDFQPEKLKQL